MESNTTEAIDFREVFRAIWKKKLVFLIVLPLTFILSCIYIVSIPRYYTTDMKLAPELENKKTGGVLSSLASSFGFDLSDIQSSDAITPLLYPDLMEDNGFVISLWNVPVSNQADSIHTTYYNYLADHQKNAWWAPALGAVFKLFSSDDDEKNETAKNGKNPINPYVLTKQQDRIAETIRNNIKLGFDKKTYIISISVTDQDPLICKTIADTVMLKLQGFITDYRTRKARIDQDYYQKLSDKAKADYDEIRNKYVKSADANTDVILESVRAKVEDMENEMQLKYDTYTTLQKQLQAAKAKVQENTPAFTVIKGSAVPVKPSGPKRMIFVAGMTFFVFFLTVLYSLNKIIWEKKA